MSKTIFDYIEETETSSPDGEEGFISLAADIPTPKDDSIFSQVASYGKSILKGAAEGLGALGRAMGPTTQIGRAPKSTMEELESQTEALDVLLPTDDTFGERAIRRGLKQAPTMIAFPGAGLQALPRSIAAGFLGEGVKELGGSELAQTAAELTAFIGPDITQKLLEQGKHGEIVKKAREMGLADKQIAPLLQGEKKQKWLTKLAPRRGKTQRVLGEVKEGLSGAYDNLRTLPELEGKLIPEGIAEKLDSKLDTVLKDLPSGVRSKIATDLADYRKGPRSIDSAINLYQDINYELGPKSKQLSLLKGPIREALKEVNPKLGDQFETLNKLYGKYSQIQQRLRPNLMTDIVDASKALQILGGLAFGYYPLLIEVAGHEGAGRLAQQMLLNPRYQQLGLKVVNAVKQNKYGVALKSIKELSEGLSKKYEDIALELNKITEEDLQSLFEKKD